MSAVEIAAQLKFSSYTPPGDAQPGVDNVAASDVADAMRRIVAESFTDDASLDFFRSTIPDVWQDRRTDWQSPDYWLSWILLNMLKREPDTIFDGINAGFKDGVSTSNQARAILVADSINSAFKLMAFTIANAPSLNFAPVIAGAFAEAVKEGSEPFFAFSGLINKAAPILGGILVNETLGDELADVKQAIQDDAAAERAEKLQDLADIAAGTKDFSIGAREEIIGLGSAPRMYAGGNPNFNEAAPIAEAPRRDRLVETLDEVFNAVGDIVNDTLRSASNAKL